MSEIRRFIDVFRTNSRYFHNISTNTLLLASYLIRTISMAAETSGKFYKVKPIKLGIEVRGISLKTEPPKEVIEQIKKDVTKYKLIIFKDQGDISGSRQVEISQWFGELESTFYKHPRSPHPDVFRVSNDENEGCTGVGRTGWHIDGSFQPAPFVYSIYHIVSVPMEGATVFASLNEIINNLSEDKRAKWERLWMVSDRRGNLYHPLIYSHPVSGEKTLCFHLGMTEAFLWDYKTPKARISDWDETSAILDEIYYEFVKGNNSVQYVHKWEKGDFIISDNLALGHEAHPSTQFPRSQVGLRVMHRTTVKGVSPPQKLYELTSHDEL